MQYFVSATILILTVGISLGRPTIFRWRIQHPGAAITGAILTLVSGLVPLDMAWQMIRQLAPSLITIVSLMVVTLVTERSGLLHQLALRLARFARGDVQRLFFYLFALGTTTGVFFTNDATILIFTPLVFALVEQIQQPSWRLVNKIPFYFAVLYVGNLVGALVISNPINIIVTSFFDIGFAEYAGWMLLPALASMVVSFVGLKLFFGKDLPASYEIPEEVPRASRGDSRLVPVCAIVLSLTLLGFFTSGLTGVPVWQVSAIGAVLLLLAAARLGHGPAPIMAGVGWDVLIFVVGIFIVVLGLRNAGLTEQLGLLIASLADRGVMALTFGTGMVAGLSSAILNNHPTAGMMIWVIQDMNATVAETKMLVFAALIGGDLGPKMLPIGSLAAMMWFRMLRARGVEVSYLTYIKVGVPVTLSAIVVSIAVLLLEWAIVGA